MKYLLYILFIYFASRGILLNFGLIPSAIDFSLNLILKGSFVLSLFNNLTTRLSNNKVDRKDKVLFIFIGVFLFSSMINQISLDMFLRFFINVFYPIGVFYFLIYKIKFSEIEKLLNFAIIYFIFEILFSIVDNLNVFLSGRILVDDYFYGLFGFPYAYQFTYACTLLSLFILYKFEKKKKKSLLLLFFTFVSVPFIAGAGRTIFIFFPTLLLGLFLLSRYNYKRILLLLSVSLILIPIFSYYKSNMRNFDEGVNLIKSESIVKNPKITVFIETISPVLQNFTTFTFGFGPGNYMSWTGVAFNPKLAKKFNTDQEFDTGAYQGYNNIIGFWGELGIIGFISFYSFIILSYIKVLKRNYYKINNNTILITIIVVYSIILSTFFHVFDDAYYSLSFWLFFAISLRMANQNSKINFSKDSTLNNFE